MPHVLVRDVPEDVHAALQRKAERRHQSHAASSEGRSMVVMQVGQAP